MKTSPPAVTMGPPYCSAPVAETPLARIYPKLDWAPRSLRRDFFYREAA